MDTEDKDSNVFSLDAFRKTKTPDQDELLESMYQMQDDLLDAMEEVFPAGCILVALGEQGELAIASSVPEKDFILDYLRNAIDMVEEQY